MVQARWAPYGKAIAVLCGLVSMSVTELQITAENSDRFDLNAVISHFEKALVDFDDVSLSEYVGAYEQLSRYASHAAINLV